MSRWPVIRARPDRVIGSPSRIISPPRRWPGAFTIPSGASSKRSGPSCHALIHTLFADRVLVHLRAAQGILRLEQSYGALRLEAACARALDAGSARYRTVKTILAKNLDQTSVPGATTPLPATYTQGGRFCRDPQTALH